MALIETEAIVLKQFDLGEADKIITFYTKDAGKIRAVAKKARNSKNNKISAVVLPYCYDQIKVYKSKSLDRINNVESIHRFEELRNNLNKMAYAAYFAEMVEKVGMEYHPNQELFNLLLQTFYKMIRSSDNELAKINIFFKLLYLKYIGVQPRINYCYDCGRRYKTLKDQFFNVKEGGLICKSCAYNKNEELKQLKQNEVDLIKKVYRSEVDSLEEININPNILNKLDKLIDEFIIYHLDLNLKSNDFLQIIKGFDKN
ncbi:MAG TPA: DNA repair protein RecO [Halanaerobiales bacterium]|nr:DNA repair protein RecO [Halanaerobiales bacterium]